MLSKTEKIEGLRLIEKIAVGGMGEVWKARRERDEGFKRNFAVKMILPHLTENQEFVQMFLDEGRLVGNLDHPNICQIIDLNQSNGIYYMLMEFIDGVVLTDVIEKVASNSSFVPYEHCCEIIRAVCAGLDHAHSATDSNGQSLQLIHRDISPPNIMIRRDGFVKIIDFGVAKAAFRLQQTQPGFLKGKIGYMSPEQVRGEAIDHRSDIFALGVVLWEMSTSRRLFWGDNEMAIFKKIRLGNYPQPSRFRDDYPPELEWAVMKALAYDKDKRFQTCAEMESALRDAANKLACYSGQRQIADYLKGLSHTSSSPQRTPASQTASRPNPPSGRTKGSVLEGMSPTDILNGFELTPATKGEQILIVDDDPDIQEIIGLILADKGYRVEEALDGMEAVEKVTHHLFDACLIDMDMPRMDGRSTLIEIKRIRPSLPCVIQTANEDFSLAAEMGRLGAVTYLLKPVRQNVLENTVVKALKSRPTVYEWERLVTNEYPTFLAQICSRYSALPNDESAAKVRLVLLATKYEYTMTWLGSLAAAAYLHDGAFDEEVNHCLLHFSKTFDTRTWYAWLHLVGEAYRRQGRDLFSRQLQNLSIEQPKQDSPDHKVLHELAEEISNLTGEWLDSSINFHKAFQLLNTYLEQQWRRDDMRSNKELAQTAEKIAAFLESVLQRVYRLVDYRMARVNGIVAAGDNTQHQLMLLQGTNPIADHYTSSPADSLQLLQVYLFDRTGKPMFSMEPFAIASTSTQEQSQRFGVAFPTQLDIKRSALYRCTTSGQLCKPRKQGIHPGQLLQIKLASHPSPE